MSFSYSLVKPPLIPSTENYSTTTFTKNVNIIGNLSFDNGSCNSLLINDPPLTNNSAVNKEYVDTHGGGGTPGGIDKTIQFNDDGVFGGDSVLTWQNDTVNIYDLSLGDGSIEQTGPLNINSDSDLSLTNTNGNIEITASEGIINLTSTLGEVSINSNTNLSLNSTTGTINITAAIDDVNIVSTNNAINLTTLDSDINVTSINTICDTTLQFNNISDNNDPNPNSRTGYRLVNVGGSLAFGAKVTETINCNFVRDDIQTVGLFSNRYNSNIIYSIVGPITGGGIPYIYTTSISDGASFDFTLTNLDPINPITGNIEFTFIVITTLSQTSLE